MQFFLNYLTLKELFSSKLLERNFVKPQLNENPEEQMGMKWNSEDNSLSTGFYQINMTLKPFQSPEIASFSYHIS